MALFKQNVRKMLLKEETNFFEKKPKISNVGCFCFAKQVLSQFSAGRIAGSYLQNFIYSNITFARSFSFLR